MNLFIVFTFLLFTGCNSKTEFQAFNSDGDNQILAQNLIISQGSVINKNNITELSSSNLEISESIDLFTILSQNENYEPIAVQWTLVGVIGDLTVTNGGHQASFEATTAGTGYIEISYQNITKKLQLEIQPALGNAPVTSSPSLVRMTEDQESIITLDYSDSESDDATSCLVQDLYNLTLSTACTCTSGECTVGVTGTSAYNGNASFNFQVSSKGQDSNLSNVDINILPKCPTGFVAVDGNTTFGTSNFCIMKFEAKSNSGTPISTASGLPWNTISAVNSQAKCETMSEGGFSGTFTLTSNAEWMTMAWDIEDNPANWSSGIVGTGHIPRGHSDDVPNALLSVTDESDHYNGTSNSSADAPGSGWEQRRTHILKNGNVIWDLAGNLWEWVDWDGDDVGFTDGPKDESSTVEMELSVDPTGSLLPIDYKPRDDTYGAANSFGRWNGGNGGASIRGDDYSDSDYSGIYRVNLYFSRTATNALIGFRCVYRP